MIKAGFSSSGINDIVYMGDVVNAAAKLASKGQESTFVPRVMAGNGFVSNINNETWKAFFTWDPERGCYTANIHNKAMNEWKQGNC